MFQFRSRDKHNGNKSTNKEEIHSVTAVQCRKENKESHWERERLLCSGDSLAETQMTGRGQLCRAPEELQAQGGVWLGILEGQEGHQQQPRQQG